MWLSIIIITILISTLIFFIWCQLTQQDELTEGFFDESECKKLIQETTITHAPNIPYDPRTTHAIGGKFCNQLDSRLTHDEGKYKFPIHKFLFDGVWESQSCLNPDYTETRNWKLRDSGIANDFYSTDRFLIVPEENLAVGEEICENNIFGKPSKIKKDYDPSYRCCLDTQDTLGVIYLSPGIGLDPIYP